MAKTDEEIINILQSLVKVYGSDWCNKRKVSAYLSDYMVGDSRQRVLSGVISSADASKVLVSGNSSRLSFWKKYCTDELYLDSSIVDWSISMWCQACNVGIPDGTFRSLSSESSRRDSNSYNSSSPTNTSPAANYNLDSSKVKCYTGWPFSSSEASRRQKETAERLGIPVEKRVHIKNRVEMEFVLIPAGEFMMGSNSSEAYEWAPPVHRVRITKPFYIGKYPVTNEQYRAIISGHDSQSYGGNDFNRANQPAVCISWDDINDNYLPKFNSELEGGYSARFPSEAEWEYACRAGTDTEYYWGNEYDSSMCCNSRERDLICTTSVGSYEPNPFGLYDMSGNVLEWCADWFDNEVYRKYELDDPLIVERSRSRVLRGGRWNYGLESCRSADRDRDAPDDRDLYIGVRFILDLPFDL